VKGSRQRSYEVTFARLGAARNAAQAASRQIATKTPSHQGRSKIRSDQPPAQRLNLHRQVIYMFCAAGNAALKEHEMSKNIVAGASRDFAALTRRVLPPTRTPARFLMTPRPRCMAAADTSSGRVARRGAAGSGGLVGGFFAGTEVEGDHLAVR
jgi:hypothetical protein